MIIIRLTGGLGNQLFQYALGRNIAILNKTKLFLDLSGLNAIPVREYELKHFNADGSNITTFFNVVLSSKILSKYDINTLDDWVNAIQEHINYANLCLDKSNSNEHHLAEVLYPIKKVIADKNIINIFLHNNDKVVATAPVIMKSPIVCARQLLIVESPNNNSNGKVYKVFFIDLTQMDNKETLYITSNTKVNEIDQDTFEIIFDSKIIIKCTDTRNGYKYWNHVISQVIPNL
jgi:hypothetical protein